MCFKNPSYSSSDMTLYNKQLNELMHAQNLKTYRIQGIIIWLNLCMTLSILSS